MKILHVPYCFYPDPVGGTEVYVESLAHELQRLGDQVVIAAPAAREEAYVHDNMAIRRFAIDPQLKSLEAIYGDGDPVAAASFDKVLEDEQPDVVHLHALTSAMSPLMSASIRERRIPLVFTYHTPTVSCPRGSLLRWGKEPCNGELTPSHCSGCVLHHLGLPKPLASLLGSLPAIVGNAVEKRHRSGGIWTALRMRSLIARREKTFKKFMTHADRVVAVSAWVQEVLRLNQVPAEKIVLCRHGLSETSHAQPAEPFDLKMKTLRLVFVGRLEPVKGLDVLFRVLQKHRRLNLTLDVYGIAVQGNEGYLQMLCDQAAKDSRIRLLSALPHQELRQRLVTYDLLVVPSQGLETGPLVVLEAFAAGIPVLGSRLGGIREWVIHNTNGQLIEATSLQAWGNAFESVARDRTVLKRWRENLPTPRSMRDVAAEMHQLYERLLHELV